MNWSYLPQPLKIINPLQYTLNQSFPNNQYPKKRLWNIICVAGNPEQGRNNQTHMAMQCGNSRLQIPLFRQWQGTRGRNWAEPATNFMVLGMMTAYTVQSAVTYVLNLESVLLTPSTALSSTQSSLSPDETLTALQLFATNHERKSGTGGQFQKPMVYMLKNVMQKMTLVMNLN